MVALKKIILHVEDDTRVASAVSTILRERSYHVVTACSAEEGLRKVGKVKPDLVILDIAMPGMSGMTVLNKLRTQEGSTTVPILIYTAVPGMVDDGARATVDGMLVKPVENETLLAEICRILESRAQGAVSS
ncbi:MAG: response regulator [Verrucomicrobia bacterium]|nr:response regulator [Verrucomicrobiota bacterium]MDA1088196.1 response regulator [Verrucomicrobiota bacterium]